MLFHGVTMPVYACSLAFVIASKAGFTKQVQHRLLRNYMGLSNPREDPLKLSVQEVFDILHGSKTIFNLKDSKKFMADVNNNADTFGVKRSFTGKYNISGINAKLTATLGNFSAEANVKVQCALKKDPLTGQYGKLWVADGTFTVIDTYDFNYKKSEASKALADYLSNSQGVGYEGRSMLGELKTVMMSRVQGKEFAITSEPVKFKQNYTEDTIRLVK